jgi:Rod binding domain-containing protein
MNVIYNSPILAVPANDLSASALETKKSGKIAVAAQQFEALMIGEIMKAAHGDNSDDELGTGDDSGGETAMGMAETQFAQAIASRGGFGLARVIEQSMRQRTESGSALPVGS